MARRAWRWLTGLLVIGLVVSGLSLTTAVPSTAMPGAAAPVGSSPTDPEPVADPQYRPADCASLTDAERSADVPVARCFALGLVPAAGPALQEAAAPPITATSPAALQQAYHLPDGGAGMTVAIVDAYGYSKAEADLAVYRSYYGLPACTTENGCFTKTDQRGGTDYPPDNAGWSVETALDLDAVSSVCPKCNILLVQGDSAGLDDLGAGVATAAARPGVVAISNSYGLDGEASGVAAFDRYYDHPGIAITVSAGDTGNVQSWPATNPNVTAVGGTRLDRDSGSDRGWTESAWGTVRGGPGGGSGCSLYEPAPSWQQDVDTSCGARKATADISADADPATGIGVYNTVGQSGWSQYGGTSLAAPLVAGMYALAGTPTPGTYPASYPYAAKSKFTDVTVGRNGPCDTKLCQAGPGWDGPTGLGTPYGVEGLTQGETGDIAGTVTDTASGKPLSGVTLRATASDGTDGTVFTATTGKDGRYDLHAPAGGYAVTASTFGYGPKTATGVRITVGEQVTQDFALSAIATRTVSGTVSDASGHGWPMRARITLDGHPDQSVYSDPYTGRYSLSLPTGSAYTLHATAADLTGYSAADVPVDLTAGSGGATADIGLGIDKKTCYATGYGWAYDGTGTDFEGWTDKTPQDGWTVTDARNNGQTWAFNDPGKANNHTGGSGNFAIVDSDYYKTGAGQDTSLVSPVIDLGGVDSPSVGFDTDYNGVGGQTGMIDYSIDGGLTWKNIWTKTSITGVHGHVDIPLPEAAGQSQVRVRFHFTGYAGAWWELDNVVIGRGRSCAATPGGLLAGVVRDRNTGAPLTGATVTSDTRPDELGVTTATPDDPNLPDGYFSLFTTHTGSAGFTAADGRYTPDKAGLGITADDVTRHDFGLGAGHLTLDTSPVLLSGQMGQTGSTPSLSRTVTFGNDGTEPVHVELDESEAGNTPMSQASGAPTAVLPADTSYADPKAAATAAPAGKPAQSAAQEPAAAPWTPMADYPEPVMDDAVASHAGKTYVIGGSNGSASYATVSVYDTASGSWTSAADLPEPLNGASAGFVGNTLYVAGGWNASGDTSRRTYAYHPADDAWTRVADLPVSLSAAGTAVLADRLYVVGGCTTGGCTPTSKAVYSYDTAADTWTTEPAYPSPVAFTACGGLDGEVVCAGGVNADANKPTTSTYAWVPGAAGWTPRAALPVDAWGAAAAVANGRLQVMGGSVNSGASVTNQGFSYDTATDRWTALPNSNNSVYRGGAACGIHKVGGTTGGFKPVAYGETLPGYDQCGGDVTWLTEDTAGFDVAPGATFTVRVSGDTTGITQPGDFNGFLDIGTDTPYAVDGLSVSMHVDPPGSWGKVTGTVTDSSGAPTGGAVVQICGRWSQNSGCGPVRYTLRTDAAGHYRLWLDKSLNSLAVQVAKDGFAPQVQVVQIKQGRTSTVDFTLDRL